MSDVPNKNYDKQDRGNLSDYEKYFAGMDASMQQKIALTTAHFPSRGTIADMGSGSGSGTFDLARLYSDLKLIGVDINPVTVKYSRNHYTAENLTFEVGDIAENVFPPESLDGILDSSVLHHVTSFNGFDAALITKTIRNQVAQLRPGGVLVIRDFVVPDDAQTLVFIDLPTTNGTDHGEIAELSTAALFEIFAHSFRCSLNQHSPVPHERLASPREGFRRFKTTLRYAAEFVLRKDYRDHWAPELLEEYTYFSQKDFESAFRSENLRIVVSMPLWNPWIVKNRFEGKFFLTDNDGRELVFPPTNYLIVGEKVETGAGVDLRETSAEIAKPRSFLKLKAYRHKETGQIYELAERPNQTIDILPWFENEKGRLFVLAKKDFPRPIVNADSALPNLNRAAYSGYLTEPISAIVELENGSADHRKTIEEVLQKRANIGADEVVEISPPAFYYTSPGGIDERVESVLVKIENFDRPPQVIENYTKFSAAGTVRELDALQVLRSSHVGGMFDARLEINIYRLLRKLSRSASAWIGATINPRIQEFKVSKGTTLKTQPNGAFEETALDAPSFLRLRRREFRETDAAGNTLASAELEYVVPRTYSKNTVAAIPFIRTADEILVGIEFRELPAPQRFTGNSRLACAPAWRLGNDVRHMFALQGFVREHLQADFRIALKELWELGGSYFTSTGIAPELVYPLAVELDVATACETELMFFPMAALLKQSESIQDAHLLILLNRLAHALGDL